MHASIAGSVARGPVRGSPTFVRQAHLDWPQDPTAANIPALGITAKALAA